MFCPLKKSMNAAHRVTKPLNDLSGFERHTIGW